MTRPWRIARNTGLGLLVLITLLLLVLIFVAQTAWFGNYVRQKIITTTEEGTGGRVEIGSFHFSVRSLEAVVTDFVIHGREPADAAPFVRVDRIQANVRLFPGFTRFFDISFLGIERPGVNVMVLPDGTTNIPEPKETKPKTDTTVLDTVVDLAVGYFRITQGTLTLHASQHSFDLSGRNLRLDLRYNLAQESYKGKVSLQPLYAVRGKNTPVVFTLDVPVVLDRHRIGLDDVRISTPASTVRLNGSIENLNDPNAAIRLDGQLALSDLKALGDLLLHLQADNVPSVVNVRMDATASSDRIAVRELHVGAGASSIDASGPLRDPQGRGSLQFKVRLALDEAGRLAALAARPGGIVVANGTATLDEANNYHVIGDLAGQDLSFLQGGRRIANIDFRTALALDPKSLNLNGLRLSALGGQFNGDVFMEEFSRYRANGRLQGFDVQTAARMLGQTLPYDGVVSGVLQAEGDLESRESKLSRANAEISIAPGRRGIPVSGRLDARYNGGTGNVDVANSYVSLPNTQINLSGSLNNRLNVTLNTTNLNDLLAAAPSTGQPAAVRLEGGRASFAGAVTGGLSSPRLTGHVALTNFSVQGRRFDAFDADVAAAKSEAKVDNGVLRRGPMEAALAASAGLQNWSPKPNQPLAAKVAVRKGDLADLMVLAGQPPAGYSGAVSLDADIGGTIGNPNGQANIAMANGSIHNQPFDRMDARIRLSDQLITVPDATLSSGPAKVTLSAEFQHPRDKLNVGRVHARLQTTEVELANLRELQRQRPNTIGAVNVNADITGELNETKGASGEAETEFLLTGVQADASARGLRFKNEAYGDVNAKVWTNGQTANYNMTSDFAGGDIRVAGTTQLVRDYPTNVRADMRNLPVERLLAVANRPDIRARGNLSGTAEFNGTVKDPQGSADLQLTKAMVSDEPLDSVRLSATYLAQRVEVRQFEVVSGPSRIDLSAQYDHPRGVLSAGDLRFKVNSSRIDLGKLRNVQTVRPGLGGALQLTASGAATVRDKGTPSVLLRDLNANVAATGIAANGANLGDLTLKASTTAGRLSFDLNSNLAQSAIRGKGEADLSGDYPIAAELTINNLLWSNVRPLSGEASTTPPGFDVATDLALTLRGPVLRMDALRGTATIPRLEVSTAPSPGATERRIGIRNEGPIVATLDRGVVRLDSGHLTGQQTDINLTGSAGVLDARKALDLELKANTNLALLQNFSRDIYSSGNVVLAGTARGTLSKPLVNGRMELKNASFNHASIPNGISNANGEIIFNGNTATLRDITGESGGGKIGLSGFVTLEEGLRLGLRANARGVRVRTQQGVSVVASAVVNVTGTTANSLTSGRITVDRVTYAPQSDFGSILTRSAPPVQAPETPNPLLDNMRLDVRIRTASATAVQASLAENIQVDADLRLRGTANRPSLMGRVVVTEGNLVFFGSKYRVSSGTIAFYNPARIEPVLNLTLETEAKGVTVVLNVTGPIDNMKLNYTSEPPLQFQEIVGLLAVGSAPVSDPTLLANQPSQPQQSFTQMGETALVSKAIADPVASRLERVFGVSQLKIDPTFTSGSDLPQARVTLQQQVATNLTFTYVSALQDPNVQVIRVEWSINPQWSALAGRDENGIVSISFLYKKQFR